MKFFAPLFRSLVLLAACAWIAADLYCVRAMNLLTDPGFENGLTSTNGIGGWLLLENATFSQDYSHTGVWSMKDACNDQRYYWRDDAVQFLPATNGVFYTVSGWAYVTNRLSNNALGVLRVDFFDTNYFDTAGPFIVLETPTSQSGKWIYSSASRIAPPGAAYIQVMAELWDASPGDVVYFDDLQITAVPQIVLTQPVITNGVFYFSFTNNPGSNFSVLASGGLDLSTANWVQIGGASETLPGYYEFSEICPSNQPQRFYRVSFP